MILLNQWMNWKNFGESAWIAVELQRSWKGFSIPRGTNKEQESRPPCHDTHQRLTIAAAVPAFSVTDSENAACANGSAHQSPRRPHLWG